MAHPPSSPGHHICNTAFTRSSQGIAIGWLTFKTTIVLGFTAATSEINRDGWTELETEIIAEHRWWTAAELKATSETVYPGNLMMMLEQAGVAS